MSGGEWLSESTVTNSYAGAQSCGDRCKNDGYMYWGLECPNSADIQCHCANTKIGYDVEGLNCKQYTKASGQKCIGPFTSHMKGVEYLHGAEGISSIYSTGYNDIIVIKYILIK